MPIETATFHTTSINLSSPPQSPITDSSSPQPVAQQMLQSNFAKRINSQMNIGSQFRSSYRMEERFSDQCDHNWPLHKKSSPLRSIQDIPVRRIANTLNEFQRKLSNPIWRTFWNRWSQLCTSLYSLHAPYQFTAEAKEYVRWTVIKPHRKSKQIKRRKQRSTYENYWLDGKLILALNILRP